MSRFRIPLLAVLLTTSAVVTLALGWFGWKNLEQEGAVAKQEFQERQENGADAIAAGIRSKLAETGERLSRWISNPDVPPPSQEEAVIFTSGEGRAEVVPRGALPFVPLAREFTASDRVFAEAEAIENSGRDLAQAAAAYRKLSGHGDPRIRAEALVKLGRVLRKARDFEGAMESCRSLASLGELTVDGLPAELVALDCQRLTSAAAGDHAGERRTAGRIAQLIDGGRWLLPRGAAEFYREAANDAPKPESWLLAEGLALLWEAESKGGNSAGSLRIFEVEDRPILTVWRSDSRRSAALAAFAERFLAAKVIAGYHYQLTDAAGRRLAGAAAIPPQTVARVIGDAQNPWMLRIWPDGTGGTGRGRLGPRFLLTMLATVILFLWGMVYFMARAIRREAAVARLQSDFVAAVSHEFRSPLTTVRQLSEMLEMGQVPSDERRLKYYHILAGEARRLQRLVETLLNFGKMEAGAQQYHFEQLDVRELINRAVREAAGEEEAAGRVVSAGPECDTRLRGDADALALALRNLIDNALKYSPNGEKVEVRCKSADGYVSISVVDHGPGIPREEQAMIFRKFVRGRAAVEASVRGTGVGLTMVRHILAAHGGEIRLESEPGCGSTFTMVLAEGK